MFHATTAGLECEMRAEIGADDGVAAETGRVLFASGSDLGDSSAIHDSIERDISVSRALWGK